MNCGICHRQHHAQRLPFLCPVDARNQMWSGRFSQAGLAIESSQNETKLNELLSSNSAVGKVNRSRSECQRLLDRASDIRAKAEILKEEIATAKGEIESRTAAIARRRADLDALRTGLSMRRDRRLEEMRRAIQTLRLEWDRSYEETASHRAFLCMEAAQLYGLKRVRKGGAGRFEYRIGGVEIVDLFSMHDAQPEVITTSLAHIAHILVIAAHYLAIRLPAEITVPRRDYPRPTIFSLSSSYRHDEVPFPGTAALLPADDQRRAPRPRPLFIDKPLSILAKEDNATYSLFVEGVAHLAYDVAWACLSQGVSIGEKKSCEDVCCIGRNLYNLLIGNQRVHHQAGARNGLNDIIGVNVGGGTGDAAAATNWMGRFSHGTAHTFLGGSEGSELVHSFRLPAPIKIADKLKKKLLTSDASVPEWEILDDEAWAVEEDGLEDGVLVSTQNRQGTGQRRRSFGSESVMTVRTTKEEERRPGLSTWTKIRRDR